MVRYQDEDQHEFTVRQGSPERGMDIYTKKNIVRQTQMYHDKSKQIIEDQDILQRFVSDVGKLLAGEERAAKLTYLILNTRFDERPVSAAFKGPPSTGKNYILQAVLRFFPKSAYLIYSATSPQALVYTDKDFKHRFIIFYESAGITNAYIMRSILSEGHINYETTTRIDGEFITQKIDKPGPTGLLTTTIEEEVVKDKGQTATRLLTIPIDDTKAQTKRVMIQQGRIATGKKSQKVDFKAWRCYQEWLTSKKGRKVVIPYADILAEHIQPVAIRLRRDFPMLLSLIRSHARMHQFSRGKTKTGKIVAASEDYIAVWELVNDLMAREARASVPDGVRETVQAVQDLLRKGKRVNYISLARELDLDVSAAHHRVKKAISLGFLYNRQTQKSQEADLRISEPLPEDQILLPPPDLFEQFQTDSTGHTNAESKSHQQVKTRVCTFDQKRKKKQKRQGKALKRANAQTPHSKSRSSGDSPFEGTTQTRGYGKTDVSRAAKELRKRGWEV